MGKVGTTGTPGTNTANDNLSDGVIGMVPIWLDLGYRVNPSIYVGGFFQYGFGFVNKDKSPGCNQGLNCSVHDIAFGADIHYHILPAAQFDPWVGAGVGYEILGVSLSGAVQGFNFDTSGKITGFQFLSLQAGGDFKASPDVAIGPFLTFALGQFSGYSSTDNKSGTTISGDLTDTGMHEWLTIGVRGQFNL